jgi:2-methylfumaryl-CoA hydratase
MALRSTAIRWPEHVRFRFPLATVTANSQLRDGGKTRYREGAGLPFPSEDFSMTKTSAGNFFEDFRLGQTIQHATPRTMTEGDVALYLGLFGARFAVQSSAAFAAAIGYRGTPLDDLLVFHVVFGKTVPDISLNAVANLGYAGMQFLAPVFAGDTLSASSEVIGLKENSNRKTGIVYVRTRGIKQDSTAALEYVRWVMVRKRDEAAPAPGDHVPRLPTAVEPRLLGAACPPIDVKAYDFTLAGSRHRFDDYQVGEKIDHVDGVTVEEAEHQIATRLYQNTARIHFDQFSAAQGRFGRRLIYGGHVISLARSLSFNGLANAFHIAAINGGRHVAPLFAGGTVFAWSEVLAKSELPGRVDVGALRLRTVATRDRPCTDFPYKTGDDYDPAVLLDLDYWALMPR